MASRLFHNALKYVAPILPSTEVLGTYKLAPMGAAKRVFLQSYVFIATDSSI